MAQLNDEWVDQMLDLYHNGVEAPFQQINHTLAVVHQKD